DLISTRYTPVGETTRRSTSFVEPSSARNVKFDHARNGSRAGNRSRTKFRAACSWGCSERVTSVQRVLRGVKRGLYAGSRGFSGRHYGAGGAPASRSILCSERLHRRH